MWRSFRPPAGAGVLRRPLKHASVPGSAGFLGENLHQNIRAFLRLSDLERRALVFLFEMAFAFIACAGTILAIFAWTGAGL
jgi:hypothetical protein